MSLHVTGIYGDIIAGYGPAQRRARDSKGFYLFYSGGFEGMPGAARDAVGGPGFVPVMQEYFVASGEHPPLEACLQKVCETDVLVVIVARRYGWVPPGQSDGGRKSITWLECERAADKGKEVLAFVLGPEESWPPEFEEVYRITAAINKREASPQLLADVEAGVEGLDNFKEWLNGVRFASNSGTATTCAARSRARCGSGGTVIPSSRPA